MKLVVEGAVREGRAIDVQDLGLSGAAVAAAVHADDRKQVAGIRVTCSAPGAVHEHVGLVRSGMRVDRRAALAAAARSRGRRVPEQTALATVRDRLDAVERDVGEIGSPDLTVARRAVAEAGGDEAQLRETVAELRGRVQTLRDAGDPTDGVVTELTRTARRLSEAETERIAAEQRLARAERHAREVRAVRDRRLRLEDRVGNLERRVRAALANSIGDEFDAAMRAIPGGRSTGDDSGPATALAIARIAAVDAPIVLEVDRFAHVEAAASWLDAPVIRI